MISTLAREEAMFAFGDGTEGPAFIDDPLFRSALPPEQLAVLRTTKHAEQAADPMRSTYRRMFETDKRNVKKLLDDFKTKGVDVVITLRLQNERMSGALLPSAQEYFKSYGLTPERLALAKPDAIVMHPGPMNRGIEIQSNIADGPQSGILTQVTNGLAVRMAVLYLVTSLG